MVGKENKFKADPELFHQTQDPCLSNGYKPCQPYRVDVMFQ